MCCVVRVWGREGRAKAPAAPSLLAHQRQNRDTSAARPKEERRKAPPLELFVYYPAHVPPHAHEDELIEVRPVHRPLPVRLLRGRENDRTGQDKDRWRNGWRDEA